MSGIALNIKVGDKRYSNKAGYLYLPLDGHLVDIRAIDHYDKSTGGANRCVIKCPSIDLDTLRGTSDWKSEKASVFDNWKKYLSVADSNGKYKGQFGYLSDEQKRFRDWFVDFKVLLNDSVISKTIYDQLYDFERKHDDIIYMGDFRDLLQHEDESSRLVPNIKNDAATSGSFTVGAAGHATDWQDAAANHIGDPLTGNLTVEGLDEETAISVDVNFGVTETGANLLKLTAQAGAEHNGGAYGNGVKPGARITMGTFDSLLLDEVTPGDLRNVEISKLALDITGSSNDGVQITDGGDSGLLTVNRMLIAGDGDSDDGIVVGQTCTNSLVTNIIVYRTGGDGLKLEDTFAGGQTHNVLNNTLVSCGVGVRQADVTRAGVINLKNTLCQNNGTDFVDAGGGYTATAQNVSEDATSPDAAYRSKDMHTGAATVFKDYAGDDYRLDSGGDVTNLAILDDGENLFGSGVTEDIQGQARDNGTPFWIGASHIAAAAVGIGNPLINSGLVNRGLINAGLVG